MSWARPKEASSSDCEWPGQGHKEKEKSACGVAVRWEAVAGGGMERNTVENDIGTVHCSGIYAGSYSVLLVNHTVCLASSRPAHGEQS